VLDGRDIGTVVCPNADVKIFVTASLEKRAERRLKELLDKGENAIWDAVLQDMKERDARDSGRSVAPLVAAADANLLDTSELDADAAFAAAVSIISQRS
jgi:cytidylate kinase